jgi:endonuclease/exonuclease/phosphatase family metal-dependent hydrolase
MRVVTLNLLAPDQAEYERRRPVLAAGLRALDADVVALQETVAGQVGDLLGDGWHVAPHSGRSPDGVGAVLASRWPLGEVREVDLRLTPRTADFPWCAAVLAEVRGPEPLGPLLVVHHKPSYQWDYGIERERQAVRTAREVEAVAAGRHVVVLGDFDDRPESAAMRFWTGRQSLDGVSVCYEDAWAAAHPDSAPGDGHTFTPVNPLVRAGEMPLERGRRIDYVLVRCTSHGPTLDVVGCALVLAEPVDGVWASDHFGVVADLELPAHPPGTGWADPP